MNETNPARIQVFNVIILDKSGSMESIRQAAVSGFNETMNGIKVAQEKYADTQEHFISLLTFCDCEKKYVYDKVPVGEARPLTMEDYQPCCCTPLYDAMGFTLTSMRNHVKDVEDAIVVVTIITDGMENASKEYTGTAVKQLVEELKDKGWTFTYMGANQDSVEVAFNLSIRNARNFDYSDEGIMGVMNKDINTRMNFFGRVSAFCCSQKAMTETDERERKACYSQLADEAFDDEENKEYMQQ